MAGSGTDENLVLGRYALLKLLGRGGMGSVYLARAEGAAGFRKPVAVKLIHRHLMDDQGAVESFIREAKLAVRLSHPNIVQVLDFGQHANQYLTVLEYLQGYSLSALGKFLNQSGWSMSIDHSAYTIYNVLRGLEFAHELTEANGEHLGLVHRDINPQNILISTDGLVTLTDFGIAHICKEVSRSGPGVLKGTLAYMSPEQVSGKPIDHRSDLFSVGIVFYEMLSGDRLFRSENEAHTIMLVAQAVVPEIREKRPELPPEASRVLNRALSKDPDLRYQTAADFAADVRRFLMSSSPDELEPSFREMVRGVFEHIGFIETAGAIPDLATVLDGQPLQMPKDETRTPAKGTTAKPIPIPRPRRRRMPRLVGLAGGVALIAALVAGGVLWGLGGPSEGSMIAGDPNVTVVIETKGDAAVKSSDAGSVKGTDTRPVDAAVSGGDTSPEGGATQIKRPQPLDGRRVTRTLMRQQNALLRCFDLDDGGSGVEQVAIRLEIASDGSVRWASIEPGGVSATPMGTCLARVARETSFPRHAAEALIFRVPIRMRQ